jgi:hypothetical protein
VKKAGTTQLVLVISVAVALLLSVVLFREFTTGILVGPLPWDDCAIVAQAFDRLAIVASGKTLLQIALQARSLAPHSPVADIQAILGLLISGGAVWGPYVLNGLSVLAAALAVGLVANARRGLLIAASLLVILLIQPLTVFSLMALKADWKSGLFFATGIYLLFEAAASRQRSLWTAGSAFLGLAILCKLTAFYLPFIAVGILGLFGLCELRGRQLGAMSLSEFARMAVVEARLRRWELLRLLAICLLPFGLFFLWGSVSYYNLLTYIRMALSPRWKDGLDHVQRLSFYGPFSDRAWGLLALEGPLLGAAALVRAWRRNLLVLLVLLAVMLVALVFFALLIVADNANIEFSGSFIGILLGLAMVAAATLGPSWRSAGLTLTLCIGFAALSPLSGFDVVLAEKAPAVSAADRRAAMQSLAALVADVIRLEGPRPAQLEFLFEDSVAGFPNAEIEYMHRTGNRLAVDRIDDLPATPAQISSPDHAVFLVLMAPKTTGTSPGYRPALRMATTADLAGAARYVQSLPDFQLAGRYPWKNAELQLFMRKTPEPPASRDVAQAPAS